MSCEWPICQMGGGGCPYQIECEMDDERRYKKGLEQIELNRKEQEERIELMRLQSEELKKRIHGDQE